MKAATSRERIKEILSYYKLSQAEFCRRTGLTSSALSNYLNGDREPRQDKVAAISDAFDLNPAWVMGYDVPMKRKLDSTEDMLTVYRMFCELKAEDQAIVKNQIEFLWGKKNESSDK